MAEPNPPGPAVVALGGGHGLAVVLRAAREYAGSLTAIVSVADDGGSSGRLRRAFGVPAPGDLRKCLVALAGDDSVWRDAFEHRFEVGELGGHALGNLMIVGLADTLGDFTAALDELGRVAQAVGRVLPATVEAVVLEADVDGGAVEGQVAVANSPDRIRRVSLVPEDAEAQPAAVAALEAADQVVLAPGSLYTSLLPVLCVRRLREAVVDSPGRVVQVANLRPQVPETAGLDATDHLQAVLEHGGRVDAFLYQGRGALETDDARIREWGTDAIEADVAGTNGLVHDPHKLAAALQALL